MSDAASFYEEDASRQLLQRVAAVFNDPDICDAVFVVGGGPDGGEDREEICAPSQFMAISSPYFKSLFYPPREDCRREIPDMQPHIFRKVIDYLFRGRVSLASVDDAWKVKAAGRRFQLKDLEDLCTKFLKYRLDSSNLIAFLKSSTKYDAPDLKEAVLNRFTREANSVLAQDVVLDLSEDELVSLLQTEPSVQAAKLMDVLIKWAKKRYGLDTAPPAEKKPRVENGDEAANREGANGAAADSNGAEAMDTNGAGDEPAQQPEPDVNLVKPLSNFMKFVVWEKGDAEYFLKKVRKHQIMSEEDENRAMAQILQSFVDTQQPVRVTLTRAGRPKKGVRGSLGPASGPDCMVVMEKLSDKRGHGGYVKTEGGY